MSTLDTTVASQTDSISFEFDLRHPPQKVWQNFGGARYGWKMMGGKLVDLLARTA